MLRYRGPLPGDKPRTSKEKQHIRMQLHPQLAELVKREPLFNEAARVDLEAGTFKNGVICLLNSNQRSFRFPLCGFDFVPLINRPYQLACQLDITWLRQERPGDIVQGGDLDNRLKCLFDALRMPHRETDLAGCENGSGRERCYCLLDDDSLITKLSVATYHLLEPAPRGHERHNVDLLIHVIVQSTERNWKEMTGMP
jgi:hypothetical protein